ncbi:hypothetical protein PLEOSDRAFT_1084238 [Pleurotus ostreatus PC15]|uniref:3'-5' exonuclease domain-containing protein n=1 Tax=Pleurotus ostreatus (strain PC15) TaxID=1137138 RepID=A0A067NE51_PLEO1|nr:hypothetical protein PLEOSDRAFT_1084238 [Pleurotus ostreatus PC15]
MSSLQYTLVKSKDALAEAMTHLQEANHVVLDLEGLDLGEVGGALSIIILRPIGSKPPSKTYIVDIMQLPVDDLTPLFDLLRADTPVKVVFDGRKDFCELHYTYGVDLRKILDMQIAEIRMRYAAYDAYLIELVYAAFERRGILDLFLIVNAPGVEGFFLRTASLRPA